MGMFNNIPAFSGLGKPSIRLEFESNEDLLEFQRKMNAGAPEPDDDPDDDGETFQRGGGDRYLIHKKLDGLGEIENFKTLDDLELFFKNNAEPFRELELNIWNVNKEFPDVLELKTKNGNPSCVHIVETPVKYLFIRDSQFTKMQEKTDKRARFFGLVKPTLKDPLLIIKEKNGDLIFIKSFINKEGERLINMCSVSDKEDFIKTNSEKRLEEIFNKIKTGETLIRKNGGSLTPLNGAGKTVSFKIVEYQFSDDKDKIKFSDIQNFNKFFEGFGAPGDTYILTDTRKKARRELDELAKFKAFEIKKYNAEEGGGWDSVKLVDIKKIYKDPARFQNRETAESSESVNRIIKDAEAGRFDWAKFDPVTLWRDPRDGKLYVLSGHSRTRAFEKLSQAGALVNGRGFDKIPAKLFQGSEAQAIDFALNSNTLSTKETEIERANYYRRKLQNGTPAAEVLEEIKTNEGKNYVRIWAYAHLNPRGLTWEALRTLQDTESENSELIKIVAEWIGKIFTRYPQLTAEHDKEIYNYLVKEGAYGKGAGKVNNYQKLLEKIAKAIERRTEAGQFNQAARLNLLNLNESSENLKRFDETKKALAAELRAASAELARKRKEFFARQKQDKSITNAAINNALQPYIDEVNSLQKKIIELESNRGQYTAADRAQQALVFEGLAKPANDYLYNNPDILDYNGYKPTYKILDSYEFFFKESDKKTSFAGFGLNDTKKLIEKICTENYLDCWDIAKHLKANTLPQSCFNLWHWLHNNIRYEYDTDGLEEVRTPRRVWADRHRGVDCDCLSVFAWCVLRCMGYDPAFELVAFKNKKNFSHIFVNCNGVLVDRVWFIFNEEPPGVTNREIFKIKEVFNLGKLF